MPARVAPPRALATRVAALAGLLAAASRGEPRAVHRARVASRRLREALALLGGPRPTRAWRRVCRDVRTVTRALGPLREADVAAALLEEDPALAVVASDEDRATLARHRQRRAAAARRQLRPGARRRLVARLRRLEVPDATLPWALLAGIRVRRRAARVRRALRRAGTRPSTTALHAVRIAVKQLRYATELAADLDGHARTDAVATLTTVQDLLGHLHDVEVLAALVRADVRRGAGTPSPLAAALTDTVTACRRAWRPQVAALRAALDVLSAAPRPPRATAAASTTWVLVRHARAAQRGPAWPDDRQRPLTPSGRRRWRAAVRGLRALDLRIDTVVSSPLVRACQTADLLADGLPTRPRTDLLEALAPGHAARQVTRQLGRQYGAGGVIALVGHEPDLGALADALAGRPQRLAFSKGGAALLVGRAGAAELHAVLPPRLLRALRG